MYCLNRFEFKVKSIREKRSRSFLPARSLTICENQALFREVISKGQYNLSFSLNSTTHTFLNPINSQWRNPCFPGKLRLAHKEFLPDFSDRTALQTSLQFHAPNEGSLALFLLASGDPLAIHPSITSLSNRQTLPIRTEGILPSLDNLHIVI